jgi:hypothetical protein
MQRKVNIAQIDCDAKENRKACNSQRIQGFPTLVMRVRQAATGPQAQL